MTSEYSQLVYSVCNFFSLCSRGGGDGILRYISDKEVQKPLLICLSVGCSYPSIFGFEISDWGLFFGGKEVERFSGVDFFRIFCVDEWPF